MKIPTNNLFELIHSMSAAEKRYFKRHYASDKNLTTELFDFVNGLNEYNEEEVKSHFEATKLAKNLKVYKVQLSDTLLKSLISYHAKNSEKSKIRQGLEEIDILLEKQLYDMALSKIRKIKDIAIKKEEIEYLIPILQCELKLHTFFSDTFEKGEQIQITEVLETLVDVKDLYKLKSLNYQLHDSNNMVGDDRVLISTKAQALALLEGELKDPLPEDDSFQKAFYRNSSKALIYKVFLKDDEKEYEFKKANVDLFKQYNHLVKNNIHTYFAALYNFLVCCRSLKKEAELQEGLVQIKTLIQQNNSLGKNALYVYYLETKHLYEKGKYKEIKNNLEDQVIVHIKKFKQSSDHLAVLSMIYFSLANLIQKDYRKFHFYLRRLFEQAKKVGGNYPHLFDILELISHLETEDYEIADTALSTLKRKVKSQKNDPNYFHHLIISLQQYLKNRNQDSYKDFQKSLTEWSNFQSDGLYQLGKEFFLEDWRKALMKQVSFADYMNA